MTKQEMIDHMAEAASISKKDAEMALDAFIGGITESLKRDEKVNLTGFGVFQVSHRAARTGVNPQNPSQKIQIPAVDVPKFKAGKPLKDALKA